MKISHPRFLNIGNHEVLNMDFPSCLEKNENSSEGDSLPDTSKASTTVFLFPEDQLSCLLSRALLVFISVISVNILNEIYMNESLRVFLLLNSTKRNYFALVFFFFSISAPTFFQNRNENQ